MKLTLPILAVSCALGALAPAPQAQQPAEATADVLIETPPANPTVPGNPPGASSKSKRPKPVPTANNRHTTTAEVKAFSFNRTFGPERMSRPLIVRNSKEDPKINAQLQEDLAVMSRILEKTAAEYRDEHEEAAGIPILALGGGKTVRALYLEDYGVVFTLNVNISLKPDPKTEEVDEKRQPPQNEEWTEARNELFGDRRVGGRVEKADRREFDQHQFEEFRDALIESLRNASNIRNLRDTDWVTMVVRGRGSEPQGDNQFELVVPGGYGGRRENYVAAQTTGPESGADSSSLVMRIKKSALDEFARQKGSPEKGSPEQFRAKVSVTQY